MVDEEVGGEVAGTHDHRLREVAQRGGTADGLVEFRVAVAVSRQEERRAVGLGAEAVADVETVGEAQTAEFRRAEQGKEDRQFDRAGGVEGPRRPEAQAQVERVVVERHRERRDAGLPAEVAKLFEERETLGRDGC